MPEMGGRELARRLAALRPSLPVLFISGYTGEDVIQRGLLDPGATFLQKPFTPDGLARKVREMLDATARAPATAGS
jgi:CheY-like chemotaxis protein